MLYTIVNEFYCDIRRIFRWWKFLIVLIATIALVSESTAIMDFHFIQIFYITRLFAFLKPKVNKLNYFLPGDSRSRTFHLLYKSICGFVFFLLWYVMIYGINVIRGYYSVEDILQKLLGEDLLFIILFAVIELGSYFNLGNTKKKTKMKKEDKLYIRRYVISIVLLIVPLIHVAYLARRLIGNYYIASLVVAYLCMVPICHCVISDIKGADTSFENFKQPVKSTL